MEKALGNIGVFYKEHGLQPSYEKIAEMTDLSTATVQRYLTGSVKRPDYTKILAIANAIGMETSDLSLNEDTVREMDNSQLQEVVLQLRDMNIEELNASDAKWRERIEAAEKAHREELVRMSELHDRQIQRVQESSKDQLEQLRNSQNAQLEIMRELVTTQKDADEKSKTYLKRQILLWRVMFGMLLLLVMLLMIADVTNPNKGWIRMISDRLMLSSNFIG